MAHYGWLVRPYVTLCRISAIPIVVLLLVRSRDNSVCQLLVLLILLLMQISDVQDGLAARLAKQKTAATNPFGELMDPIADKLYINSTYLTLSIIHNFPI